MKQILFIVSAVAAAGTIAFTASANIEDNSQTLSQIFASGVDDAWGMLLPSQGRGSSSIALPKPASCRLERREWLCLQAESLWVLANDGRGKNRGTK